ncbi:MAG TPA: indole-3-glycerol phosphate synthase TrpC, partial [Polyangia bacterium]|nr:indole-3-glycerol phosphate synthase TrpC [Polyangia bacterium]
MSLIRDILKASLERLNERKRTRPIASLKREAASAPKAAKRLREALESAPFSVIAEVKARSPSGGTMDPDNVRNALEVYRAAACVSAISILTDQNYFGSSVEDLTNARSKTSKPILRKDFIVDEYQVWEARAFGADAILLMAGVLAAREPERIQGLYDLAIGLGMDVLFEIGMSEESLGAQVKCIPSDAAIWGVNSRRFKTSPFSVSARLGRLLGRDFSTNSARHHDMIKRVPPGKLPVAESGIEKASEVHQLVDCGYRAALIGTAFLRRGVRVEEVMS